MTIPGEIVGFHAEIRCFCRQHIPLRVCFSNAGYYLGYFCDRCGPYSRETGYYATREEAEKDLEYALLGVEPLNAR